MFIVVAFIFMGIFVGYGFRKNKTEWLSKVINLWVWILLFLWATICGGIALPWFCGRFLGAIPRHDVVYVVENSSEKGFCNSVAEAFL